jgi:hypothetical protein
VAHNLHHINQGLYPRLRVSGDAEIPWKELALLHIIKQRTCSSSLVHTRMRNKGTPCSKRQTLQSKQMHYEKSTHLHRAQHTSPNSKKKFEIVKAWFVPQARSHTANHGTPSFACDLSTLQDTRTDIRRANSCRLALSPHHRHYHHM